MQYFFSANIRGNNEYFVSNGDNCRSIINVYFYHQKIMVGDKTIDIPLIALISHHYLAMDNVQIKFKAKVGSVESQIPENNLLLSSPHRANLQMQMSNIKPDTDDVMEVCVNFKVQETPESISRIIDDFVKNI